MALVGRHTSEHGTRRLLEGVTITTGRAIVQGLVVPVLASTRVDHGLTGGGPQGLALDASHLWQVLEGVVLSKGASILGSVY